MDQLWLWIGFNAFVLAMLALDLGVFHRRSHVVSIREAAAWSAVWVALALGFSGVVFHVMGERAGMQFLAGYLIEKALSVDNIFVFVLIFSYFRVPPQYQHRVLFWGILGALVMRGAMIGLGAYLIQRFEWVFYAFGAFLVWTGFRMAMQDERPIEPETNRALGLIRRLIPVSGKYDGPRFFTRESAPAGGRARRVATPLFVVLVLVETTDLIFAVDSIPAVFAVTRDPFLVYSSNVFAILGLRALYFLLSGIIESFRYLRLGLSAVLVFVGAKMILADVYEIPIGLSLAVIGLLICASMIASLLAPAPVASPEIVGGPEADGGRRGTAAGGGQAGLGAGGPDDRDQREPRRPDDGPGIDTIRQRVEVAGQLALTPEAAAGFVVLARRYRAEVVVLDRTRVLDGKSFADIATLAAPCGPWLDLEARGPDAREAVEAIAGLFASQPDWTDDQEGGPSAPRRRWSRGLDSGPWPPLAMPLRRASEDRSQRDTESGS